ncbi:MAG TPA: hypothetical protein VNG13_16035 [Mycobacteriales bacterium]|nr:hypothetical protein [Mycobacteriales bacterium]
MGVIFAALGEDLLGELECLDIDERLVGREMVGVAEEDLTEVRAVAQDGEDGHVVPGFTGFGSVAVGVEPGGNAFCAVPLACVVVEDDLDEGRLIRVGHEVTGGWVDEVAVWA